MAVLFLFVVKCNTNGSPVMVTNYFDLLSHSVVVDKIELGRCPRPASSVVDGGAPDEDRPVGITIWA